MNKTFIFHLVKFPFHKKRIEIAAGDSVRAFEILKEHFSDWQISMFWVKWPF